MDAPPELRRALLDAQRAGFLGSRPIEEVIEHARGFVDALDDVDGRVVDLGSGGGVPGLVIAHDRPDLRVTLLDRRAKRTDFLARVVRRLGWTERVEVVEADAEQFATAGEGAYDAAVARGFGPPFETLRIAARLTRLGGAVVISEPPVGGDRWAACPQVVEGTVVRDREHRFVVRFTVLAR
jgi:16S rRNA (guanine527-N7)-methyltransferase